MPHALLLSGPAGMGISGFARHFARLLLCENPSEGGTPCQTCKSCLLAESGSHPDLQIIEPEEPGKQLKIDQIRDLIHFTRLTSQYGRYKVAIIEPAEAMNISAVNSLLKTLEEPPPRTLLMLVSQRPMALPVTVRSRCQRIEFSLQQKSEAIPWLAGQVSSDRDFDVLLDLANGAPLTVVDMLEQDRLAERDRIVSDLEQLRSGTADPVAIAEQWSKIDAVSVLFWLSKLMQDLVRLKFSETPPLLQNRDLVTRLQALAERLNLRQLLEADERVNEFRQILAGTTNVAQQGLLEAFAIQWTTGTDRAPQP